MKFKPASEGYKSWALCDAKTGFVYGFQPVARVGGGSVRELKILMDRFGSLLPDLGSKRYVIAMDNFFTTSSAVKVLYNMGIGCIGIARGRRGWPPKELRDVKDDRFNTVYTCVDDKGVLVYRWVDNKVATMISTIHSPTDTEEATRRKPRITLTNAKHVERIWKDSSTVKILIPQVIRDYNNWMGGFDIADQLIAYYSPNFRYRRTWMPLMGLCLNIIRTNSYTVYKNINNDGKSHKQFIEEMIEVLMGRVGMARTRKRKTDLASLMLPKSKEKRRRTSTKNPVLPPTRTEGDLNSHVPVDVEGKSRPHCVHCSFLMMKHKNQQRSHTSNPPKISRCTKKCLICNVPLCKACWGAFHRR